METPVDLFSAVAWVVVGLATAVLPVGIMMWGVASIGSGVRRGSELRRLARARCESTKAWFVRSMVSAGAPQRVAEEAHRYVAEELGGCRNFPVWPADSLAGVYGVGQTFGVEAEQVLRDLTVRCGVPVAVAEVQWPPIRTVRDLVLAVAEMQQAEMARRREGHLLRPAANPAAVSDRLVRPAQVLGPEALLRPADEPPAGGSAPRDGVC